MMLPQIPTSAGGLFVGFFYFPSFVTSQGFELIPALPNLSPVRAEEEKKSFSQHGNGSTLTHVARQNRGRTKRLRALRLLITLRMRLSLADCRPHPCTQGSKLQMFQPHCRPEVEVVGLPAQPTCSPGDCWEHTGSARSRSSLGALESGATHHDRGS